MWDSRLTQVNNNIRITVEEGSMIIKQSKIKKKKLHKTIGFSITGVIKITQETELRNVISWQNKHIYWNKFLNIIAMDWLENIKQFPKFSDILESLLMNQDTVAIWQVGKLTTGSTLIMVALLQMPNGIVGNKIRVQC